MAASVTQSMAGVALRGGQEGRQAGRHHSIGSLVAMAIQQSCRSVQPSPVQLNLGAAHRQERSQNQHECQPHAARRLQVEQVRKSGGQVC